MRVELVAELGSNHGRSFDKAVAMIRAAASAGANAVKVSMFTPEQMAPDSDDPRFQITDGLWAGRTLYDLYCEAAMPVEYVPALMDEARANNLKFIAGIYHPDMVQVAEKFGIERYKIASFEIDWQDLWDAVLETGKPIIASLGATDQNDPASIWWRVFHRRYHNVTLLHCVSHYPARADEMHLATLRYMRLLPVHIGLSDHTTGSVCAVLATTLGATMIEKHFKIDENGLDVAFSLSPDEFLSMVEEVRRAETIMGCGWPNVKTETKYKRKLVDGQWFRTVT